MNCPALCTVALLLVSLAVPAPAATLAWKFAAGDEYDYRLTQSSRLSSGDDIDGKQLASVEQVLDLHWKVLEVVESGDAKISLEVTAISLLAKGPDGQEVEFDSQSAEEPQGYASTLAPIGKRLAESPITFSIDARGAVTDVRLPDELAEAARSVPGGKKLAQDGGQATVEALAQLGAPRDVPQGKVSAEQSWSAEQGVVMPVLGAMKVEFIYTVAKPLEENEITIKQQMLLRPAGAEQVTKVTNQKSTGTIIWNAAAGRPETSLLSYQAEISQQGSDDGIKLEHNTEFRRIDDKTQ